MNYDSLIKNNRVKEGAMRSTEHRAGDVFWILDILYGIKDRTYDGVELFDRVPTEDFVLHFDKLRKQTGNEEIA